MFLAYKKTIQMIIIIYLTSHYIFIIYYTYTRIERNLQDGCIFTNLLFLSLSLSLSITDSVSFFKVSISHLSHCLYLLKSMSFLSLSFLWIFSKLSLSLYFICYSCILSNRKPPKQS